MKKAILPSKVYLVCSSGLMKAELVVFSQKTVTNDKKNRLIATKDDRFGNFMCKYALIVGALIAGLMIASGGTIAAVLFTILLATGVSLSMCGIVNLFNGGGWKQIHPTAFAEKKNMLTDKSYFSCPIGGTIFPIYDKNIASQQAEIFRTKALTEVTMSLIGGYMLGSYGAYCVAAQVGFGSYASGIVFAVVVNKAVNKGQEEVEKKFIAPYTERQKNSDLYNREALGDGFESNKVELPTDEDATKTIQSSVELEKNKEQVIREGTANAQNQRVNPNAGSLNNPYNRNKFKTQETDIKARYGRHNYRRSQEWTNLQREKADYNRSLGQRELNARRSENLKSGGKGFMDGFNPVKKGGAMFWASTVFETVSDIVVANEQRRLLDAAIDPETKAKQKIGVYADKG